MILLYLNTVTGEWFLADGTRTGNGNPAIPYRNHETVGIQCVTDTTGGDTEDISPEEDWPKDTQFASFDGVGALLTADNNYLRHLQGTLSSALPGGGISTIVATISGASVAAIPDTGTIRVFDAVGDFEELEYASRTIDEETDEVTFALASGASTEAAYADGSVMDCGEGVYAQAALDAENSDPATGYFQFDFYCYGKKLRLAVDYTDAREVSDVRGIELLVFSVGTTGETNVRGTWLCDDFEIPVPMALPPGAPVPTEETVNNIAVAVHTMLAYGFALQFSADNENWHDTQTTGDLYYRFRSKAGGGTWSSAIAIPSGAPGKDGEDGASAYDIWLANGHEGTEADFLEWLKGADGSGVNSATATTLSPGSAATASLVDGVLNIGVPRGNAGVSTYIYVAYAEDSSGTGFSLEPSNTRKYRAEIHTAQEIATPTASDFAGATWVKFIGNDGDGAFTVDDTLSSTSENAVQNKVIKAKLDTQDASIAALQAEVRTKQPTLSYDTAPTPNSNNPVTSGGIYAALQDITPGGGGDSIADENVVSPIDSIATIKDYYDNAQHGFAAGIQKIMVAANANTDSDTELKNGHAYAVITLPEAITTETITIWQWVITWTATTRLHLMTTAEAEAQEREDIYGRFGGDYYRDETGGGWLRDDRAWRIISGTLSGDSTQQFVVVPGSLKWDTMSFGDIYSGIQAIETDPGHIDGKLCGTTQPGTQLTDYEPYIGGRVVRRVYTLRGLTILIHDITPCVCGSCPLEARIAALENA